ncbi:hypothetical protein J4Q44_G00108740, partial [Coregonus suidteri]
GEVVQIPTVTNIQIHWFDPAYFLLLQPLFSSIVACEPTLDLNTVSRLLSLSQGNRQVTGVQEQQPYPDHPERFDCTQVLCTEGLSGHHYWEAKGSGYLTVIGVAYKGISRKGNGCVSEEAGGRSYMFDVFDTVPFIIFQPFQ